MGYWLYSLKHAHHNRAHCERIDFYVEEKQPFTESARTIFESQLEGACHFCGVPEYIPLIGRLVAVAKDSDRPNESLPVQSADLLLWLYQREAAGRLSDSDRMRLNQLRAVVSGWDQDEAVADTEKQGLRWKNLVKGSSDGIT